MALSAASALSQTATFPLESVAISGSTIPQPVILEIAKLRISAPINKAGLEQACARLQESGIFSSISYRYAPGPKKGYALTLMLADQAPLAAATIDVPGVDEDEAWRWLAAKFQRFDHRIPQAEPAQKYLAGELARHLGNQMRGQPLVVRMETDLKTRKLTLSFQPETLPRVRSVVFNGNQAIASSELASAINRIMTNAEYTDRWFASAIELNLRPLYEQHGYYRLRLAPGGPHWMDGDVSVNVAVTEGAPYKLGKVEITGEDLSVDALLAAAKFPHGKLANYRQIQEGIWEIEKVVKRTGFFEASASPERIYDDTEHVLDLRIRVNKGPLYRFGEVRFTGLTPELEALARRTWKSKPGDPYDHAYPHEFLLDFSHAADFRMFRRSDVVAQKGAGDHVMDIKLVFESR